jgi:hypothetical protein
MGAQDPTPHTSPIRQAHIQISLTDWNAANDRIFELLKSMHGIREELDEVNLMSITREQAIERLVNIARLVSVN